MATLLWVAFPNAKLLKYPVACCTWMHTVQWSVLERYLTNLCSIHTVFEYLCFKITNLPNPNQSGNGLYWSSLLINRHIGSPLQSTQLMQLWNTVYTLLPVGSNSVHTWAAITQPTKYPHYTFIIILLLLCIISKLHRVGWFATACLLTWLHIPLSLSLCDTIMHCDFFANCRLFESQPN